MIIFSYWRGAKWWAAGTVAACAGILLSNLVYLPGGATPRFLWEKHAWAQHAWWLAAFYFHVLGASVCLATGTPLMFPAWTRRNPAWHRRLGYVYFNAVLWMAAPTGMALALTAKGGLWGTAGFLLAGALWWLTTWQGYVAIRRREIPAHVRAMVRSYCWALSAPAFRLLQIALFVVGMDDASNYVASLWLSIAVSIGLAEIVFVSQSPRNRASPGDRGVFFTRCTMNRWLLWPASGCLVAFGATVVLLQNAVGGAAIETATRGLAAITEKETAAGDSKPMSMAQAATRLMGLADEYTRPWRQWSSSPQSIYSRAGVRPIPPIATELVWLEDERQPSADVLLATIVVTKGKQPQAFPCVVDRATERVCICADGQWITAEVWLTMAPTP